MPKPFLPWALVALVLTVSPLVARASDTKHIQTPRGAALDVLVDLPSGGRQVPVVILAPGTGYHMRLPLMNELTRSLVRSGVAVYRFNWAYFVADPRQGKPSDDRATEVEDLQTVLALARGHARTRQDAVVVAGKSLGSIVAWRVFRADPSLAAALLLTPACNKATLEESYAGLAEEKRPTQWIAGDRDPVCEARTLQRYLATAAVVPRSAILTGNHGFEPGPGPETTPSRATLRAFGLAAALSADFLTGLQEAAAARGGAADSPGKPTPLAGVK